MPEGYGLGLDAVIEYKIGGQSAGGSWVELTNVTNVTLNGEKAQADVTTRASEGWRQRVGTLRDGSVSFDSIWDPDDAGFTALKDVWLGLADPNLIGLRVLDKAFADGGQGLQADFDVLNFTREEPLEDAIKTTVEVSPTRSDTAPSWVQGP